MSKCPYCNKEIHLEDFFIVTKKETKKGKIKTKILDFKGEYFRIGLIGFRNYVRMWACPLCDTILGFSEMDSDRA